MESEDAVKSDDSGSTRNFLTAEDLLALRKPGEETDRQIVGPKFYTRSELCLEDKAVDSALQSYKDTLDQKCAGRICDLMQAEWNEELKVSFTDKLKGKFVQHIGRFMDGKIALSPEESLFLLENGCIEILNGEAPMSLQEAYSVMLSQDFGIEKYQVYSRLSQLGFIVVPHNRELGAPNSEKKSNAPKHEFKNKRKNLSEKTEEPNKKRLNFSGALSAALENSEDRVQTAKDNVINSTQTVISSSENSNFHLSEPQINDSHVDLSSPNVEVVDLQQCDSSKTDNMINTHKEEVIDPVSIDVSNNLEIIPKVIEKLSSVPEITLTSNCKDTEDLSAVTNDLVDAEFPANNKSKPTEPDSKVVNVNDAIKVNDDLNSHSNGIQEPAKEDRSSSRIDIDVMEVDSQDTEVSCCTSVIESSQDGIFVESGKQNTISVSNNINGDNIDIIGENVDIVSCSSQGISEASDISLDVDSGDSILDDNDEEITLLEVTKKGSKPLAVIDLLSDNEEQPEEQANSDDEITVVKVCSGPSSSRLPSIDQIKSRKFYDCKKEERSTTSLNPKVEDQLTVRFPDLFRKEVVCVARPPLNLLPSHVKPSKDSYILDFKQKSEQPVSERRMWNSYRDVQDYQRFRRFNRHSFQTFDAWNQNRADRNSRPYESSSRDHHGMMGNNTLNSGNNFGPPRMNPYNVPPTAFQNQPYRPDTTSINSIISFQQQDMNLSFVRNQSIPQQPNFSPNIPNLSQIRAEVQRAAMLVTTSVLSSMFGQNLDPHHIPPIPPLAPTFPSYGPSQPLLQTPYRPPLYNVNFRNNNDESFRWRGPRGKPFPCHYRNVGHKRSWEEIKAAVGVTSESPDGSDVEEVPISPTDVLWDTGNVCPLVKAGVRHPTSLVLESLERIPMAKLLNKGSCNVRCFPEVCSLEISYDVYLPGFNYRKTCPDIPKHRIIIVRSTDPLPKYSELAFLQRKWQDGASLQLAVVDHGQVSFMSFSSVSLPKMTPHQK